MSELNPWYLTKHSTAWLEGEAAPSCPTVRRMNLSLAMGAAREYRPHDAQGTLEEVAVAPVSAGASPQALALQVPHFQAQMLLHFLGLAQGWAAGRYSEAHVNMATKAAPAAVLALQKH